MPLSRLLSLLVFPTLLLGCPGTDKDTSDPTVEVCDNNADDDGDGQVDCDDSDCATDAGCDATVESNCIDGVDNDGDGQFDCDDSDCADNSACAVSAETNCTDGFDEDGDGFTDCDDNDCANDPACIGTTTEVECANGVDDDEDGVTDCDDPDCFDSKDCATPKNETVCDDGLDEDGDGLTDCDDPDCVADPACIPTSETDCGNETDDDGDGATDCDDADCADAPECAATEALCDDGLDDDGDGATDCDDSDCADAPECAVTTETLCDDGLDDDGDGATDCDDSDCASDPACVSSCAEGSLGSAIGASVATGTTVGGGDNYTPSCPLSTSAEDVSWYWVAPADGTYTFDLYGSAYDTALIVLSSDCSREVACNDDREDDLGGTTSAVSVSLAAGEEVVVVVDGYGSYSGAYDLAIYSGAEFDCDDELDEDGDGLTDCEDSDCGTEPRCIPEPVCDDGLDDDEDGLIDCDDDDCTDDLVCSHPCADDDLESRLGEAVESADTTGAGDDSSPSCGASGSEDRVYLWTAPADATYTFTTAGSAYNTALALQVADCTGTEIDCNDVDGSGSSSSLSATLATGDEVLIVVDSRDGTAGAFTLSVYASTELECADGVDDDSDGAFDCDDSDCAAAAECSPEAVCDDGLDDDLDGSPDCLDTDCAGDAACDTSIADFDLGSTTGLGIATGDTTRQGDNWAPACASSAAEDVAYAWVAPATTTYTFDMSGSGYDSALALFAPDGAELACDDDSGTSSTSLVTYAAAAGEMVIIDIDGYSRNTGTYTLAIY